MKSTDGRLFTEHIKLTILALDISDTADVAPSCACDIPAGPAVYLANPLDALPLLSPTAQQHEDPLSE